MSYFLEKMKYNSKIIRFFFEIQKNFAKAI